MRQQNFYYMCLHKALWRGASHPAAVSGTEAQSSARSGVGQDHNFENMIEGIPPQPQGGTPAKRLLVLLALLPALLALNSCKGKSSPAAAAPSITVSGAASSVNVNGTVQFTASILNLSSTLVNWQVNGVTSGNTTVGTIDTTGLYKAPATPPTNNVVTITAVAQAQTSLTATANLTILPPAAITGISPSTNVIVAAGLSQAFSATVSGGGSNAVFWYVNNSPACSSTIGFLNGNVNGTFPFGQITPQGNYKAPQIPPSGAAVAITAVSQTDSTQTFCVPVTLTFGNASLQGAYAFSTSGRVIAGNTFFARAGSFTADGQGHLIGGHEDVNPQPSGITTLPPISFSGSYSIGPDGRGTMQFCEPSTSNVCPAAAQTSQFRIVVLSAQQVQIIEFSSLNSTTALTAASGEMDLQPDTSAFNTSGLAGTYTFNFAGLSSATAPQSEVGEFAANGLGGITSGEMDVNGGGAQNILSTSSYSISTDGRGVATIITSGGTFQFSFYMVSANRAKFIETDAFPLLVGDAFKQQTVFSWGDNALSANTVFVFETAGSGPSGGIADLVSFTSDGNGNVIAGGMLDQNSGGTVTSVSSLGTGSYTIDSTGRGTLIIPGHSYVFYMVAPGTAVIQETTAGVVAHGSLVQPQGGPFTAASLSGSYALNLTGQNATPREEDFVGQLTANGTGNVTSGSLDINNFGATQTGVTEIGTYTTVAANGRTTMLLNPTVNFVLYFVSPTQIFALDTDSTGVAIGSLYKQF
ncbi:MAG: hypothetical protein LAN18_15155 [Acidobacteriia bacterium]|nr:hypothetical protein [Terriglobia bacterium]